MWPPVPPAAARRAVAPAAVGLVARAPRGRVRAEEPLGELGPRSVDPVELFKGADRLRRAARLEKARAAAEERAAKAREEAERRLALADRLALLLVASEARRDVRVQRGAAMGVVGRARLHAAESLAVGARGVVEAAALVMVEGERLPPLRRARRAHDGAAAARATPRPSRTRPTAPRRAAAPPPRAAAL